MQLKQMTVEEWEYLLLTDPRARHQLAIIERRKERGLFLATWEQNFLEAYRKLPIAAE